MRITEEEKARNRAKIVETAGRLFRERGIANVGIADLMREAGFTHGGFYNHFESKEALAAEVCGTTSAEAMALISGLVEPDADDAWKAFVESYLSIRHRDDPSTGCTLAALVGDASRQPRDVQAPLASIMDDFVEIIGRYFSKRYRLDEAAGRRRAIEAYTQIIGAISMSRATVHADRKLADEILTVARDKLLR